MITHPSALFQSLLQERLTASTGLAELSATSYDNVPPEASMPYVCHGGSRCETEFRHGARAFRIRHVVESYDRGGGRAGVLALQQAIDQAVSLPPPSNGQLMIDRWAVEDSSVGVLADGRGWRGLTTITARVRATVD